MRIIAVDDEAEVLNRTEKILRETVPDAELSLFSDCRAAIKHASQKGADVALLDIRMPQMDGMELAYELKCACPNINIIFATGYADYAAEAFRLRASGYVLKPVTAESLKRELSELRNPIAPKAVKKPFIRTFGNFDIFVDGKPVEFHRSKSKEVLAYLTDRKGAAVTTREIASVCYEDREFDIKASKNLYNITTEMINDLKAVGADSIVGKRRGELFLYTDAVDCDYYRFLEGDEHAVNSFKDEYMTQYSWGEYTLGSLLGDNW